MNSCIYQGRVLHRRLAPVEHDFTYKLFMMYLDLSEIEQVFRKRWLWSTRWPAIAWFRRKEHLGDPNQSLDVSVRNLIEQRTGESHAGPIRLLTHLRYFGFQMNPVSFYFCFDNNEQLQHIVAEVNNTPWGQQHCYLLAPENFSPTSTVRRVSVSKDFHVSPFLPMDMTYQWRVTTPGQRLNIGISNFRDADRVLNVAMTMQRQPMTARSLGSVLLRYPMMTGKVFAGIYWQAFRLWRKKLPFFPHPDESMKASANPAALNENLTSTNQTSPEAVPPNV